jgi:hypothetical protein
MYQFIGEKMGSPAITRFIVREEHSVFKFGMGEGV